MSNRFPARSYFGLTLAAACLFSMAQLASAAAGDMRVLHHQAVQISSRAEIGAAERVTFEAYGRRFDLSVAPNERIRRAMNAVDRDTMPLQGTVEGASGSWVRITRSASGWRGMIYDGHDLYAIEPASDVSGATVEPLNVTGSAPVVYRLSDALLPLDTMSCEIAQPVGSQTAASAFSQLSQELRVQAASAELSAAKQVRVGVVGDFEFVSLFGVPGSTTPEDAIVARMNIVDGIFMSQIGVKVSLAPSTLFRSDNDPFTTSKASDLLAQLRTYRMGSLAQSSLGVSHLMTGRDLDGDTVGIAYIGSVCDSANGASLSEGRRSTTQSALIAAHEIGHNFGAPHDGESGLCSSTPQTFLMAPRLNGSDQFSACSIQQIQPVVNTARCLTTFVPPDIALVVTNPSLQATVGAAFVASFRVQALGDDASRDVTITTTLPTSLTLQSVAANGGTCTSGAGTATCTLTTLPSGDTRQIDLTLTATENGTVNISLALNSSNDANTGNNSGAIAVTAASANAAPTPPPTGGTTTQGGGGGGGGRLDFVLLALLFGAHLKTISRSFASTRCFGRASTSAISPSPSERTAVSIFMASSVTSRSPRATF
jgi:Metallo-peptidase family M12/Domain of unknown function DUF11